MKKLNRCFLSTIEAPAYIVQYWTENCEGLSLKKQIKKLFRYDFDSACSILVKAMEYDEYVSLAIFSADLIIDFNSTKQNRKAIKAAKNCLKNKSKENKIIAEHDAYYANDAVFRAVAYSAAFEVNKVVPRILTYVGSYSSYPFADCSDYRKKIIDYCLSFV